MYIYVCAFKYIYKYIYIMRAYFLVAAIDE